MPKLVAERFLSEPAVAVEHAGAGELVMFLHGIGGSRANRIAASEFVVVEGSGHLVNIERPQEFDRAVLDFLLRHRQPS